MRAFFNYFNYIASVSGALAALAALPSEASAFCRTTTTGSQPVPDQCPTDGVALAWPPGCAALSLDTTVLPEGFTPDSLARALTNGMSEWNSISCASPPDGGLVDSATASRFALVSFGLCADGVRFDGRGKNSNTLSFRTTWADTPSFPPGAIAVTIVSFAPSSGRILDTDVVFNLRASTNPEGFVFSPSTASDPRYRDFDAVLVHELGHVLGLAHSDDRTALMTANYNHASPVRAPRADDRAGACAIYPEGTSSGPCDPGRNHPCGPGCACATPGAHTIKSPRSSLLASLALLATIAVSARRSARSRPRPSRAP
ncbi:MAG: matrixin family metalloprotease [Myxococcales bacterium]|nr:matrixin family metalloprotease [Myxococcales bacterium]